MSERVVVYPTRELLPGEPVCCGEQMQDDGGCAQGCCDDFKCLKCGKRIRIEWPD
jgi:tRNA(Ile2) C34 agmatinyltransferase TiaS